MAKSHLDGIYRSDNRNYLIHKKLFHCFWKENAPLQNSAYRLQPAEIKIPQVEKWRYVL